MRLAAYVIFLIFLGVAGWAGQVLWQGLQTTDDVVAARALAARDEAQPPVMQKNPPRRWPAVFGQPEPPVQAEPQPPAQEEPTPPPMKFPPLASQGYVLKGMVRKGEVTWALVSHPSGERVLRVGDALQEGLMIARIDESGLWALPEGGEEMQLEWPD